jgi:hypothetical protein
MPAGGYTTVNPLLALDANGVFHLQPGSPAIGAALGSFPYVTVDMDGQQRDADTDTGADELTAASIRAQMLTTNDVGPNSVAPKPVITSTAVVGGNLVITGTNGLRSTRFYVLASTNLGLPLGQWTAVSTNTFSGDGRFSFLSPLGGLQRYFVLQMP